MTRLLLAIALIATAALLRRRHPAPVPEPVDAYVPMAAWLPIPNLLGVLT